MKKRNAWQPKDPIVLISSAYRAHHRERRKGAEYRAQDRGHPGQGRAGGIQSLDVATALKLLFLMSPGVSESWR